MNVLKIGTEAKLLYKKNITSSLEEDVNVSIEGMARCHTKLAETKEALNCYLDLLEEYDYAELKQQCAMLVDPNDKRIHDWLKSVIDDETISADDLLACGQLAAKNKDLIVLAQLAYNKAIGRGVSTGEQHNACAEISSKLRNREKYALHKREASKLKSCPDIKPPRQIIPYQESVPVYSIKNYPLLSLFGKRPTGITGSSHRSETSNIAELV